MQQKILGFVKYCNLTTNCFTKDKIYPYYEIGDVVNGFQSLKIQTDQGLSWWTWIDAGRDNNRFKFYHPSEFPKDISTWTEDDWFQYHLKYGG